MRHASAGILATMAAACGGSSTSPTAPSTFQPTVQVSPVACAAPATDRVHTVPVAGSQSPLVVWVERVTPVPGSTVRVGSSYQVDYGHVGPSGVTASVQVSVGDGTTPGVFASVSSGGCGRGFSGALVPRSDRELRVYVRVWLTPGALRPGDPPPSINRPPDYEASDALNWTVVP